MTPTFIHEIADKVKEENQIEMYQICICYCHSKNHISNSAQRLSYLCMNICKINYFNLMKNQVTCIIKNVNIDNKGTIISPNTIISL